MLRFAPALLSLRLSTIAHAQENEESPSFGPSIQVTAGLPSAALPFHRRLSLAADLHGHGGVVHTGEPFFEGGLALGFSWNDVELKPLGAHVHCHGDEGCEPAYSAELYWVANSDWAFGASLSLGTEGLSELRAPVIFRGFNVTPSIHQEERAWHGAVDLQALFQISPYVALGPHCSASPERITCGLSAGFGDSHPH